MNGTTTLNPKFDLNVFPDNDAGADISPLELKQGIESNKPDIFQTIIDQDFRSLRDMDIAKYFLQWMSESVFYNVDTLTYHIFDGTHYKADRKALLLRQKLHKFLTELVNFANRQDVSKQLMNRIYGFKDARKIEAIITEIQPEARKENKEIDKDEYIYLFNVENGILDLRNENPRLLEHSPKYLITQKADVNWRPELGEVTGEAREILLSFFLNNESVLSFLFEFLGTALTGFSGIRKFIFAFGSGKNGKSTLFNFFLNEFFGNYGAAANFHTFTKDRNNSSATSDLFRILNKRFVVANEVKKNSEINPNLLKSITGGDQVGARLNYQNEETYKPRCKIILFGNNQLRISDGSEGMQDRFAEIPFLAKFTGKEKRDQKEIWEILKANKSQILNSLIAGYYRYRARGEFDVPESIRKASLEGFASANNFTRFMTLHLEQQEGSEVKVKDAFGEYKKFADKEELTRKEKLTRTLFIDALKSKGIKISYNIRRTAFIRNFCLKNDCFD